jgi:hypothetical protein
MNYDVLVSLLMPIETSLLDEPMARLHAKAFDLAWDALAATTHQIQVASAGARVKKQTIQIPAEPWTP